MAYCNGCADKECEYRSLAGWNCSRFIPKTNADRFRAAMSDEALADEILELFAAFYEVEWSYETLLNWLKEEAE